MRQNRKSSALFLAARVAVISFLAALTTFAVTLFCGIVGIAVANLLHPGHAPITSAYRYVALPAAGAALVIALAVAVPYEIRRARTLNHFTAEDAEENRYKAADQR